MDWLYGNRTEPFRDVISLSSRKRKGNWKAVGAIRIQQYGIQMVTVNEQNPQAVGFYEHLGFVTYQRTDHDEQGNPYPLLYMKLA